MHLNKLIPKWNLQIVSHYLRASMQFITLFDQRIQQCSLHHSNETVYKVIGHQQWATKTAKYVMQITPVETVNKSCFIIKLLKTDIAWWGAYATGWKKYMKFYTNKYNYDWWIEGSASKVIMSGIYIIISKNTRYLLWNRGARCFFHDTYLTIEVQGFRCTNHLHDSCP